MTDWEFVQSCQQVTRGLTNITDGVDGGDRDLDKAEAASMFVMLLAMRELKNELEQGDDSPFKFDDDHTFK